MQTKETSDHHGYRFPREIISQGVWLYHRFALSFRDVEELLAKRGVIVTCQAGPSFDGGPWSAASGACYGTSV